MRFARLAIIALALLAAPAQAQNIDGYRLNIYPAGAADGATPTTFFDFVNSATTCNLVASAPTAGTPVNPTRVEWDDPNNTGRVCRWTDPGTGPLFAVPFGSTYDARLQAFNAAGVRKVTEPLSHGSRHRRLSRRDCELSDQDRRHPRNVG
jgi:hypothetical protein